MFSRLCEVGLKLHPQKCVLSCPEAPYLGYVISAEGILPNPDKILAVKEFPAPTNVREFLGLASYYRRFVPYFTKEAGPLHMLTRANVPFVWSESGQESFIRLKELLTSPLVLAYPDFLKPFVLDTDASGKGLGAVLVPDVSDSEEITEENDELVKLQRQDEELGPVVTFLEQGLLPPEESMARQLTLEKCRYVILDKVLYQIADLRKNRLCLCVPVCTRVHVYETRTDERSTWWEVCWTLFTQRSILHDSPEVLVGQPL